VFQSHPRDAPGTGDAEENTVLSWKDALQARSWEVPGLRRSPATCTHATDEPTPGSPRGSPAGPQRRHRARQHQHRQLATANLCTTLRIAAIGYTRYHSKEIKSRLSLKRCLDKRAPTLCARSKSQMECRCVVEKGHLKNRGETSP